jgi:hypothetical protein
MTIKMGRSVSPRDVRGRERVRREIDISHIPKKLRRSATAERSVRVPFTFSTSSPLLIGTQASNEMIVSTLVVVTVAFNGGAPTLQVGTAVAPSLVFAAGEVKPHNASQYETDEVFDAPLTSTAIRLTITPSGSTAGAGYVIQTYRKT